MSESSVIPLSFSTSCLFAVAWSLHWSLSVLSVVSVFLSSCVQTEYNLWLSFNIILIAPSIAELAPLSTATTSGMDPGIYERRGCHSGWVRGTCWPTRQLCKIGLWNKAFKLHFLHIQILIVGLQPPQPSLDSFLQWYSLRLLHDLPWSSLKPLLS